MKCDERAKRVYCGFTAKMQNETILKWDIIEKKLFHDVD